MSSDAANTLRACVGDWALAAQIGLLASPTVATALADLLKVLSVEPGPGELPYWLTDVMAARDALESAISRRNPSAEPDRSIPYPYAFPGGHLAKPIPEGGWIVRDWGVREGLPQRPATGQCGEILANPYLPQPPLTCDRHYGDWHIAGNFGYIAAVWPAIFRQGGDGG